MFPLHTIADMINLVSRFRTLWPGGLEKSRTCHAEFFRLPQMVALKQMQHLRLAGSAFLAGARECCGHDEHCLSCPASPA